MNFQELAEKLKRIDEGVEAQVQECGEMSMMGPMGAMPQAVPAQQDTVSMNISMNAQGPGGIRDLMNVLRDIQSGPDSPSDVISSEPHGVEIDADPELDIAMPNQHDDEPDIEVVHLGNDDEMEDEGFANEPEAQYQSQDYMHNTLAGGADEPQKMNKGGYRNADNAITMAAILPVAAAMGRMGEGLQENLVSNLSNLYQEVKLREGEKKTMSRAAKGYEKYGKKGMEALAKAGKEGKDLDKIRDKYNKYD